MSSHLWKCFFEDDVDAFRQCLAGARARPGSKNGVNNTSKFGSPGYALASSPKFSRSQRHDGWTGGTPPTNRGSSSNPSGLSRADLNARDAFGRTLLHHIASSQLETAFDFATALLEVASIDLYAQDTENGWTALHRALYFGNVAVASALMARDIRDATAFGASSQNQHVGGLIKIKDREGNGPFDLYNVSTAMRDRKYDEADIFTIGNADDAALSAGESSDSESDLDDTLKAFQRGSTRIGASLDGDEVYTFGSNKNLSLGLGDEDDRQFPEKVTLKRPASLLSRLHKEALARSHQRRKAALDDSALISFTGDELPALIAHQTPIIQDVVMSKFATAIITTDVESNLHISGFGPGGRLGLGDESTRFDFECVEAGCLSGKKVISVALGQDHAIALTDNGEVFTWGSNKHGQLGYNLPGNPQKHEDSTQLTPRQVFGPLKKELVVGAAASAIHSVVFTADGSLFTWGKNYGQLGIVDADSRALETQAIPRRVGVSLLTAPIRMVAAIDRATICLSGDQVFVFTQYGFSKVLFNLDGTSDLSLGNPFSQHRTKSVPSRFRTTRNVITKIIAGGNTFGAISSFGEVFTVPVEDSVNPSLASASTTNPSKIRNALPTPTRIWSIRKSHMRARDAAIDHNESIIICTESGSLWKKEKRPKINSLGKNNGNEKRAKDYKFARIPGITRAAGVRSNAFGAFAAIRRDVDVFSSQKIKPHTLWTDIGHLLPFRKLVSQDQSQGNGSFVDLASLKALIVRATDLEEDIQRALDRGPNYARAQRDIVWMRTSSSKVEIPVHEFILTSRSDILRTAFSDFRKTYFFALPGALSIEYGKDGGVCMDLKEVDFLTLLNIVYYMYTDGLLDVWHQHKASNAYTARSKQMRLEVMKLASVLHLANLERATRLQIEPEKSLHLDMEDAYEDPEFSDSADSIIELDGGEARVHSALLKERSPFFEGLFSGAGGRWLSKRLEDGDCTANLVRVDLKHFEHQTFELVLRHLYADSGEELFEEVSSNSAEDFVDLVIDTMAAANELMLDRLSQVCQKVLGKFANVRNVCHLLNAVAPCSVTEFKTASLEYICLNMDIMLQNRSLDDLDEELFPDLDEVVRDNQLACLPFARSGRAEAELFETYPELLDTIARNRQTRVDYMSIRNRPLDGLHEEKSKYGSVEKISPSPQTPRPGRKSSVPSKVPTSSPGLTPKKSTTDLLFQMDDELGEPSTSLERDRRFSPEFAPVDDGADLSGDEVISPLRFSGPGSDSTLSMMKVRENLMATPERQIYAVGSPAMRTPWQRASSSQTKVDMKGILADTTKKPTSAMSSPSLAEAKAGGSFKVSQKERKKQQQQQLLESESSKSVSKAKSGSPWQVVTPTKPVETLNASLKAPASATRKASPASASRPILQPTMTMRQTISGRSPNFSEDAAIPSPSAKATTPTKPTTPTARPTPSSSSRSTSGVPIQSVRHIPVPVASTSPSFQLSMADILSQQQLEKDAIREATMSKRSLQEIQEEQAFQEWWDAESRRVMAEEASRDHPGPSSSHAGRGRGKGRSRGGGGHRGRGGGRERNSGKAAAPK